MSADTSSPTAGATTPDGSSKIGRAGEPLRVFAFASGGLDATMQLGTIHALLATGEKADVVLGISAGAVSAVALGEVLKIAPEAAAATVKKEPRECIVSAQEAASVGRFLEILEAYREVPMDLLRSMQPDPFEVSAGKALQPLELPTQFSHERAAREDSLREKNGLIRFLNGVLDIRVPVSALTRFVRLALGFAAAGDLPAWPRRRQRLWTLARLWVEAMRTGLTLSPSVGQLLWASCASRVSTKRASTNKGVPAETIIFRRSRHLLRHSVEWVMGALAIFMAPLLAGLYWLWTKIAPRDRTPGRSPLDHVLDCFSLKTELGDSYALEQAFVRFFDPDYYGRFSMDKALATSLSQNRNCPQESPTDGAKKLSVYMTAGEGRFPIHVVPVAANLQTCELEWLPADIPVIKALMASTALVPIFKVQQVSNRFYIDGANVSNQPIREALRFLQENKDQIAPGIAGIMVYSVTPFPIKGGSKRTEKASEPPIYTRVIDLALRAIALARLRDAELEQELMKLYNSVLPLGQPMWKDKKGQVYFRAEPVPIATGDPLQLNEKIPAARTPKERRELIAMAVAEGCRLSLEQFIAKDPKFIRDTKLNMLGPGKDKERTISCASVISLLRVANNYPSDLPGADSNRGPGIPEICRACSGKRCETGPGVELAVPEPSHATETVVDKKPGHVEHQSAESLRSRQVTDSNQIPEKNASSTGAADGPRVALLFGGGVFRGVFQVGVANALRMLLQKPPYIVAGASVGSITASLIAQLFCEKGPNGDLQMRRLAATYLALDRFVLTDRMADFVRRFSIRAGNADFSVRDVDLVLRRFEASDSFDFGQRARRVAAGLERLFYLSPFAFYALVRDLRLGRRDRVWRKIQDYIQEMFNRYGAGFEILGAEPLSRLLREHVLRRHIVPGTDGKMTYADMPEIASFDFFAKDGIELLATVTNLTEGKLDVLTSSDRKKVPRFVEGLLASSAFPAVFRPRWSWEVFITPSKVLQFSDGGMFDNLPFHPVIDFMRKDQSRTLSKASHLIFTASLEAEPKCWNEQATKAAAESWLSVKSRASEMKFNKKIDDFVRAQSEVRSIFLERTAIGQSIDSHPLLVKVLAVKPQWLCGTFAFHPMLGFRREDQARSIAHGCYQTLKTIWEALSLGVVNEAELDAWGFKVALLKGFAPSASGQKDPKMHREGQCWHNSEIQCPFSEKSKTPSEEEPNLAKPLNRIYEVCGDKRTHSLR